MTRISKSTNSRKRRPTKASLPGRWPLQDAKARLSEVVRLAKDEGPQIVTVHGREEVVVISAEEFQELQGKRTGEALIAAMQSCPHRDFKIEPPRDEMPVRDISL